MIDERQEAKFWQDYLDHEDREIELAENEWRLEEIAIVVFIATLAGLTLYYFFG